MDNRRLNTGQVLASGILNIEPPKSDAPENAIYEDVEEFEWSQESLLNGLNKGGLHACMYYGCWKIWKAGEFFSGELMQYRNITDSFYDSPIEYALDKAEEWASNCQG